MIVALSPGHSDITTFCPWSPIMLLQEIIWIALNEEIPKVAQTNGTVEVFDPHSSISGLTLRRASACPDLQE
jgi:hypothetical protein